jgi:hypothetical protein
MRLSRRRRRKALWIGLLLLVWLVIGCAGIELYEPGDYREEGPERGVLTGAEGEFVLYRKAKVAETGGEADKTLSENTKVELSPKP